MKPILCLLPILIAAPVFSAENSSLADLLPPDTQIVFGIHVRAVVESELAKNLTTEMKGQAANWQNLLAATGFDPLHDLDEVLIASSGNGQKGLVVARGKFDIGRLAPNADSYNGVPLVPVKNSGTPTVYGFLDDTTALGGNPEMVRAVIDHQGQAGLSGALASQVAEYRDRYDVWAIVNRPEGLDSLIPQGNGPASALRSIDHFQFGVSVKDGLQLAAEVHARSAKDEEQLAQTLQFLEAMSKASQPAGSPSPQFSFKKEDGTLKVALAVSAEELKKAIENQKKAQAVMGIHPIETHPALAAVAPAAPAPAQPTAAPQAPEPVSAPAAPARPAPAAVYPGDGPETHNTAVFTLPGRP